MSPPDFFEPQDGRGGTEVGPSISSVSGPWFYPCRLSSDPDEGLSLFLDSILTCTQDIGQPSRLHGGFGVSLKGSRCTLCSNFKQHF